jgi:transposase InsO family protein
MRQAVLRSRRRVARRVHTTDSRHERPVAPNLLERDFSATANNEKWLGDIMGVWTDEGWLYLAALLDTFSRMIVGWAMSEFRDEALVQAALDMALARRELRPELIHHTDRGSQYTADRYQSTLTSRPYSQKITSGGWVLLGGVAVVVMLNAAQDRSASHRSIGGRIDDWNGCSLG